MNATVITIGDEILIGQIVDTNSTWISSKLSELGIKVKKQLSISDLEDEIVLALTKSVEESDITILTGGLGPTNDDRTKYALSRYFKKPLVRDLETLKKIEGFLSKRGVPITTMNQQQADLPEGCTILKNDVGSVPGMLFNIKDKIVVSVPGVPFEMKSILEHGLFPYLKENYTLPTLFQKTFLTVGEAESVLAENLADFEDKLPDNYSLAYLPSPGTVRLRLTANNENLTAFDKYCKQIEDKLGNSLFGYNDQTMEEVVGELLKERGKTVCTAESCTGGTIASKIVSVAGASAYFRGGIVCYCNKLKNAVLQVSSDYINNFGAVSQEVVIQMAENAKANLNTDYAIATSGVAGPAGGSEQKPVGTVWVAVSTPQETIARKFYMGTNRERTISRSSLYALNMLRLAILNLQNMG